MMLAPGHLNRRLTIQQRAATPDSFGQQSTTWSDLMTVWACIKPLAGRELVSAQAINAETTHEVTIRYSATAATITVAMRAVYQGRILGIVAPPIDVETAHVTLRLLCSEALNLG